MTEQPLLPPPEPATEPHTGPALPPRGSGIPWLYGLGFLILAAAIFYVWQNPRVPSETEATASGLRSAEQHLSDIDGRIARLEQRPVVDLGKITSRVDALESRLVDQTQLASRLDAISGRIESLSARDQTALDSTKQRLDALTTRLAGLETATVGVDAVNKRLTQLARLQEASLALAYGRPIGELPGAPDAIARYAHTAPPTEAGLRLSFPQAEQAALAAKPPEASQAPFVDRVWEQAQGLVTIRRGDDVVIGNSSSTILSQAQTALEAGDLSGAVQVLETLNGPAGRAMASWLAQAKGLLGARSALTAMAGQA